MALDTDNKTFVVHIATLAEPTIMPIYLFCKAQVTLFTSIKIPTKYFNFSDIFSLDSAAKLLEHTRIKNHFLNLLEDK